jgi:DNA-directed RNA polymerase specialized sigma24 family protein
MRVTRKTHSFCTTATSRPCSPSTSRSSSAAASRGCRARWTPRTFRVVVHQVIGWTIADHFGGRPTDVPLPEGWEPADDGEGHAVVSRYYLEELIATLPEQTRRVVELRYLRGLEPAEIAGELGMKPNAVYQRLHQGHQALRETLTRG